MPESTFTVTFGGRARAASRIPVRVLSPALLALSEMFADASVLVDPDREPATLSVDTIEAGATTVRLVLEIAEQSDRLTDLLTTDAATTLKTLEEVVLGPTGILHLTRQIANREISDQAPVGDATLRLTLADGTELETRREAAEIYLDRAGRRNASAVTRPLHHPGVETLEVCSPNAVPTLLTALDAAAFEVPARAEVPVEESEVEMLVDVAAPALGVDIRSGPAVDA